MAETIFVYLVFLLEVKISVSGIVFVGKVGEGLKGGSFDIFWKMDRSDKI